MVDLSDGVSQDRLMEWNRAIARWTRLSGTPDERAAADYVADQLRASGYDVRIIMHDAYISLPGRASLRVASPQARDIRCITHSMGIPTPPDGVTSALVHAGRGEPEDYPAPDHGNGLHGRPRPRQ